MSEENTAPTTEGEGGERDEIDLADLAARLKERVDAIRKTRAFLNENGPALRMHDDLLMASRALLSSPRVEREWCLNCGTITRDHRCHCTEIGQEPNFVNYADELARQMNAAASSPREERAKALEEAAKVADEAQATAREEIADEKAEEGYDPYAFGSGFLSGELTAAVNIAKAIRALKEAKP